MPGVDPEGGSSSLWTMGPLLTLGAMLLLMSLSLLGVSSQKNGKLPRKLVCCVVIGGEGLGLVLRLWIS